MIEEQKHRGMYEDWKEWARNQKTEVWDTAGKYSGSFVKALIEAFLRADNENTEKLLNAFPEYFGEFYQIHLKVLSGGKE